MRIAFSVTVALVPLTLRATLVASEVSATPVGSLIVKYIKFM